MISDSHAFFIKLVYGRGFPPDRNPFPRAALAVVAMKLARIGAVIFICSCFGVILSVLARIALGADHLWEGSVLMFVAFVFLLLAVDVLRELVEWIERA